MIYSRLGASHCKRPLLTNCPRLVRVRTASRTAPCCGRSAQPSGRQARRHDGLTHSSSTRTLGHRPRRPNIRKHRRRRALSARAVSCGRSRARAPRTTDTEREGYTTAQNPNSARRPVRSGPWDQIDLAAARNHLLVQSARRLLGASSRERAFVHVHELSARGDGRVDCLDGQRGLHGRRGGPTELAECYQTVDNLACKVWTPGRWLSRLRPRKRPMVLLLLYRSAKLSRAQEASGRAHALDTAQVVGAA